ncbi:MAG: hypothetical protein CO128_04280 [Ignavibacteriales bacterium CG_4_9_14_3_um_filter_30_11]|nr:MAG: hypothetical protein CO128_04280 [Ignavibacteriales bacterium CG_4_9_14_3_um_filter_30_11]
MSRIIIRNLILIIELICLSLLLFSCSDDSNLNTESIIIAPSNYPTHTNINTTIFWIGELADSSNAFIANDVSAWDGKWKEHYGGTDDPNNRNGYYPQSFTPKQNPFYFALPYNDINTTGIRKQNALSVVYWGSEKTWGQNESLCKNRWIKIIKGNLIAYAQWEDVGPFETDDNNYVFGSELPRNTFNGTGLDVSPAVRDFLGITGLDKVSWQFVAFVDVPEGPWKNIITSSQIEY